MEVLTPPLLLYIFHIEKKIEEFPPVRLKIKSTVSRNYLKAYIQL